MNRQEQNKSTTGRNWVLGLLFVLVVVATAQASGLGRITAGDLNIDEISDNGNEINVTAALNFQGPNGWPSIRNPVDVGGRTHLFFDDQNGSHLADLTCHDSDDPAEPSGQSRCSFYVRSYGSNGSDGILSGGWDILTRYNQTNMSFRSLGNSSNGYGELDLGRNFLRQPVAITGIGEGTPRMNITSVTEGALIRVGAAGYSPALIIDDGSTRYVTFGKNSANYSTNGYDLFVNDTITARMLDVNVFNSNDISGISSLVSMGGGTPRYTLTSQAEGALFRLDTASEAFIFQNSSQRYLTLGVNSANFTGLSTYDLFVARRVNMTQMNTTNAQVSGVMNLGSPSTTTLSSDVAALASTYMVLDTESAAASDVLHQITGGREGNQLFLRTASSSRDITINDSTSGAHTFRLGNSTAVGANITLSHVNDVAQFIYMNGAWVLVAFGDNDS